MAGCYDIGVSDVGPGGWSSLPLYNVFERIFVKFTGYRPPESAITSISRLFQSIYNYREQDLLNMNILQQVFIDIRTEQLGYDDSDLGGGRGKKNNFN